MTLRYSVDGPTVRCSFETTWCRNRAFLAGGGDEHHEWPKSMGGSDSDGTDGQHLLTLCPTHHRRQHALIRTLVENPTLKPTTRSFVRPFAQIELDTALYAVTQWRANGSPPIDGWPCDAAVLKEAM